MDDKCLLCKQLVNGSITADGLEISHGPRGAWYDTEELEILGDGSAATGMLFALNLTRAYCMRAGETKAGAGKIWLERQRRAKVAAE